MFGMSGKLVEILSRLPGDGEQILTACHSSLLIPSIYNFNIKHKLMPRSKELPNRVC